jgi:hypothetical protein
MRPAFECFNGLAPAEDQGPIALQVIFDFSVGGASPISGDLLQEETTGAIDKVQAVYVDNSANGSSLTLQFFPTGQKILIPANKQGCYPVICGTPLKFTATSAGNVAVACLFLNVPLPVGQWG